MVNRKSRPTLFCSFCRKSNREVRKLIGGPGVYICDACVGLCNDILDGKPGPGFAGKVDVTLHRDKSIEVADNGSGVSDEDKTRLFEPNFSTKKAGMGLGLTIVSSIIGDHGGVIECDSAPRRTSFRIMLPMAPLDSQPSAVSEQGEET